MTEGAGAAEQCMYTDDFVPVVIYICEVHNILYHIKQVFKSTAVHREVHVQHNT